ncbi:MAG: hypothetical protein JWR61_1652 [Ferruginibacter sp.]|nr:hypothetical protein [Ferruginibacter sp.]
MVKLALVGMLRMIACSIKYDNKGQSHTNI